MAEETSEPSKQPEPGASSEPSAGQPSAGQPSAGQPPAAQKKTFDTSALVRSYLDRPEMAPYVTQPIGTDEQHAVRANWLLYLGVAGFIFASFLLFNGGHSYHDVYFSPRDISLHLLDNRRKEIVSRLDNQADTALRVLDIQQRLATCIDTTNLCKVDLRGFAHFRPPDKVQEEWQTALSYFLVQGEIYRLSYLTDTSFSSRWLNNNLFVDKDSVMRIYTPADGDATTAATPLPASFRFTYIHDSGATPALGIMAAGNYTLRDSSYQGKPLSFFLKYPNFGIWSLLLMIQFIACFIIIPLSMMTIFQVKDALATNQKIKPQRHWFDLATSAILVTAFAGTAFFTAFRQSPFRSDIFMHGYHTVNLIYMGLAHLAAITCFAGFLYTGRILAGMLLRLSTKATEHKGLLLTRMTMAENASRGVASPPSHIDSINTSIDTTNSQLKVLKDEYIRLQKYFTIFFVTSAFLLSMVVLQMGALFSAVGSLDLIRYLSAPVGVELLRPDFIYLFGGIYSLLLLMFYLPVKVSMVNLQNTIPDLAGTGSDNTGWLASLAGGLKNFSGVITAGSPLLLSIIQYIISSFGQK